MDLPSLRKAYFLSISVNPAKHKICLKILKTFFALGIYLQHSNIFEVLKIKGCVCDISMILLLEAIVTVVGGDYWWYNRVVLK